MAKSVIAKKNPVDADAVILSVLLEAHDAKMDVMVTLKCGHTFTGKVAHIEQRKDERVIWVQINGPSTMYPPGQGHQYMTTTIPGESISAISVVLKVDLDATFDKTYAK